MGLTGLFKSAKDRVTGGWRNAEIVQNVYEAKALAEQIEAASASLTNPDMRVELPAGFPPQLSSSDAKALIKALEAELEKHGTTLGEVGHINIAYPHKHPGLYRGHYNSASDVVRGVKADLMIAEPGVAWLPVDGLVERVKLGRSENQTSVHALTAQQVYDIHAPDQKTPLPFGPARDGKKEFFIVVDTGAEQGTTYANMISFILHNGGAVLAAVAGWSAGAHLRQVAPENDTDLRRQAGLKAEFNDASRNTGRLAEMALAFASSARESGKDWTPAQCLEMFEEKLRAAGNSVFAMTNGEAERLINTVNNEYLHPATFVEILDQLDKRAAAMKAAKEAQPAQAKTRAHPAAPG